MSRQEVRLRPRFAGNGRLRLPVEVTILRRHGPGEEHGDVVARFASRERDPFERTGEDILLAEAFARVDLERPKETEAWYLDHGVPHLGSIFPALEDVVGRWVDPDSDSSHDVLAEILDQQDIVRWILDTLVYLTDTRDEDASDDADVRWRFPALRLPNETVLWLSGASGYERRIPEPMQRHPSADEFRDGRSGINPSAFLRASMDTRELADDWWPRAHAAWQEIEARQIPILWVPNTLIDRYWSPEDRLFDRGIRERDHALPLIGLGRAGLIEVVRRLIEPYVRRAAMPEVEIVPPVSEDEIRPLEIAERRVWTSILAPIHLQLLEALRRVSQGLPGATHCRECGQPFLVLDSRRSSFCNDRERYRFAQRERRRRLATAESDR
jgi:hypothetical protein